MSGLWFLVCVGGFFYLYNAIDKLRRGHDERVRGMEAELLGLERRLRSIEAAREAGVPTAPATVDRPAEPVTVTPPEPSGVEAEPIADAALPVSTPEDPVPAARGWQPPEPAPSIPWQERLPSWVQWFWGGNTLVRVGVVALFFGVAFLLKFVSERITFPIEMRLVGVALVATGLVAFGWHTRRTRPGYGLSLQGGGIGLLYLTVYAAFRLYSLLPAPVAFGLMLAIVIGSGLLAARQDSLALAMLGALGGFLAPILASTGQGSHVALFTYYGLLNVGILGLAWVRSWRPLNLLGFAFTFVIATAWGVLGYRSSHFATTEPFLAVFFAMYLAISVLYARLRSLELKHYVDGTIVFGLPLVVFGLQAALVHRFEHGLVLSAVALAAVYAAVAAALRRHDFIPSVHLLVEAFFAIAVVFATLAIPLHFEPEATTAAWSLEAAGVAWVARRQGRALALWFAVGLQLLAVVAFSTGDIFGAERPILNPLCLGLLVLAAGFVATARQAWLARGQARMPPEPVSHALFVAGAVFFLLAGWTQVDDFTPARFTLACYVAHAAFTAALALLLHRLLGWRIALAPGLALLPLLVGVGVLHVLDGGHRHPFEGHAWAAWFAAFAVLVPVLRECEEVDLLRPWGLALQSGAAWYATLLLACEAWWQVRHHLPGEQGYSSAAALAVVALAAWAVARATDGTRWPFGTHPRVHLDQTAGALAGATWLGMLVLNVSLGATLSADSGYLPLANPIDLATLLGFAALWAWHRRARERGGGIDVKVALALAASVGFWWANAVLLRTLHHWAGVPADLHAMSHSQLVQVSLTVFWTALAVTAMLAATRKGWRAVWMVGGGLLGVVVVKLFFFDLARLEGVERIVAFLAVGGLLLALGYFSPVPPKATMRKAEAAT